MDMEPQCIDGGNLNIGNDSRDFFSSSEFDIKVWYIPGKMKS